jgi:hypothetical protein
MSEPDCGPATAGTLSPSRRDDPRIRLSPHEFEVATILEFDPEAEIAPGSLPPVLPSDLICSVPSCYFSPSTWLRLARGIDRIAQSAMDRRDVAYFLDRRSAPLNR